MSFSVRCASLSDLEALAAMAIAMMQKTRPGEPYEPDIIRERLRAYLAADDAGVWVVESEGRIVGFMLVTAIMFDWRSGCVTCVRMCHTGHGPEGKTAHELLAQAALSWSRERGAEELFGLHFDPQNAAVMRDTIRSATGSQRLDQRLQ